MTQQVALIASGVDGRNAVGSRIGGFARGLARRGWGVRLIDLHRTCATPLERLLEQAPAHVRRPLEALGVEGDVQPGTGWRARQATKALRVHVAVVSVPPFSLLGIAAVMLNPLIPLVVDYRDPWGARHRPPLLARVTRLIERPAARRAAAITYAGGPVLGELLVRHLRLPPHQVISVPNGFNPSDVAGLRAAHVHSKRDGRPLDLVMNGYWYGRNGPGILLDALGHVGPTVARLTVIGGVSEPVASGLRQAIGRSVVHHGAALHRELYERLQEADAAVVTVDKASAVESRIPAKVYDYLATGVPVIAICPHDAALLRIPGAERFHHVHHRDTDQLVRLLVRASRDRTTLRAGTAGEGPSREQGVDTLHRLLRTLVG